MKHKILALIILLSTFSASFAVEADKPLFEQKAVQSLVQDYAQFLTPKQDQKLQKKLIQLSKETSTQILFVTVNDLFGYDKNDYASRLGIAWQVGGKEDNGVVILVQPKLGSQKGQVSIQVGYGMEGVIPDIVAKRIVEHEVIPNFKKGKYYRGIDAAVNVITDLSKGKFTANKYLERNKAKSSEGNWAPFVMFIAMALFFGIMRLRGARQYSIGHNVPFWIAMGMMSSSRGGSFSNFSSGGGSFGGGGFGGFGGGSFGGGGAGGSW